MALNLLLSDDIPKLSFAIREKISAYGPVYGRDYQEEKRVTNLMFDKLINSDNSNKPVPVIVTEIPSLGDFKTNVTTGALEYIFTIRDDIYWYIRGKKAQKLTAQDVEFTYNVLKNDNVDSYNDKLRIKPIADIKAISNNQIKVSFHKYSANNFAALTFHILPSFYQYETLGDRYSIKKIDPFFHSENQILTTGRYYASILYKDGTITNLVRNDEYYLQEYKPRIKEIDIRYNGDLATIVNDFLAGYNNLLTDVPISRIQDIQNKNNLNVIEYKEYSIQFLAINFDRKPLDDVRFREAMTLAINKDKMNHTIFQNRARLSSGPIPPLSPFYNHIVDTQLSSDGRGRFGDPDMANEILDEAGYKMSSDGTRRKNGPISLDLVYLAGDNIDNTISGDIQEYLKDIGIEVNLVEREYDEFHTLVYEKQDFDLALIEFKFGADPNISPLFKTGGEFNISGYSDKTIDDLLDRATVGDKDGKGKIYKEIHRKFAMEDFAGLFLWQKPYYVACENTLRINENNLHKVHIFMDMHKW